MSMNVVYVGPDDVRQISNAQWASIGISEPTRRWEKTNSFEQLLGDIAAAWCLAQGEFVDEAGLIFPDVVGGGGGTPADYGSNPSGAWATLVDRLDSLNRAIGAFEINDLLKQVGSSNQMVGDAVQIASPTAANSGGGVTVTAGNATIPWTGATANMVGMKAIIAGAGVANANLTTTVQSVVVGTSITLTVAPSTARPAGTGYGIVGTDNTATFSEAITWAKGLGCRLVIGPGNYLFDGSVHNSSTANSGGVDVKGTRGTRFFHGSATTAWFGGGGTAYSSSTTFGVAANAGDRSVTLSAAPAWAAADTYAYIRDSSQSILSGPDNIAYGVVGELVRIRSIVGSVVTFWGPLRNTYTTTAKLEMFAPMQFFRWEGIEFINPVQFTGNGSNLLFNISSIKNIDFRDCTFRNMDSDCMRLARCVDGRVKDCNFFDMSNDSYDTHLDGTTTLGYTIKIVSGSANLIVDGVLGRRGRHLVTTIAGVTECPPCDVLVCNSIGWDHSASTFDTHPGAERFRFLNCQSHQGKTDLNTPGVEWTGQNGFQVRGRYTEVIDCYAEGSRFGVNLQAMSDGSSVINLVTRGITGYPYRCSSTNDVTIMGGRHDLSMARGLLWVCEDNVVYLNHFQRMWMDNVWAVGNPSVAALDFNTNANDDKGIWRDGFYIGENVHCPDATVKSSANRAVNNLASAATINLPPVPVVNITGTTNITAIGPAVSARTVLLTFAGTLTIAAGATIGLNSTGTFKASAGSWILFRFDGVSKWYEIDRSTPDGGGGGGRIMLVETAADLTKNNDVTYSTALTTQANLQPNAKYRVRVQIFYTADATADVNIRLAAPAGCTGRGTAYIPATNTANATTAPLAAIRTNVAVNGAVPCGGAGTTTTASGMLEMLIVNGATAGTLSLEWAEGAAVAIDTVLLAGSWMSVERLT